MAMISVCRNLDYNLNEAAIINHHAAMETVLSNALGKAILMNATTDANCCTMAYSGSEEEKHMTLEKPALLLHKPSYMP